MKDAKGRPLQVGDIVQLDPDHSAAGPGRRVGGCLMQITNLKTYGALGMFSHPGKLGEPIQTFLYRAKSEDMQYVGPASFVIRLDTGECLKCGAYGEWTPTCDKAYEWEQCNICGHKEKKPGENPGFNKCDCERCTLNG